MRMLKAGKVRLVTAHKPNNTRRSDSDLAPIERI